MDCVMLLVPMVSSSCFVIRVGFRSVLSSVATKAQSSPTTCVRVYRLREYPTRRALEGPPRWVPEKLCHYPHPPGYPTRRVLKGPPRWVQEKLCHNLHPLLRMGGWGVKVSFGFNWRAPAHFFYREVRVSGLLVERWASQSRTAFFMGRGVIAKLEALRKKEERAKPSSKKAAKPAAKRQRKALVKAANEAALPKSSQKDPPPGDTQFPRLAGGVSGEEDIDLMIAELQRQKAALHKGESATVVQSVNKDTRGNPAAVESPEEWSLAKKVFLGR
eukprot:gene10162-3155_t